MLSSLTHTLYRLIPKSGTKVLVTPRGSASLRSTAPTSNVGAGPCVQLSDVKVKLDDFNDDPENPKIVKHVDKDENIK